MRIPDGSSDEEVTDDDDESSIQREDLARLYEMDACIIASPLASLCFNESFVFYVYV